MPEVIPSAGAGDRDLGVQRGQERPRARRQAYTVPVPQTTIDSGTFNLLDSNGALTFGTYAGSSTTTQQQLRQGRRTEWTVDVAVLTNLRTGTTHTIGSTPIYTVTRRAPVWAAARAKPDKAAFVAALDALELVLPGLPEIRR
jgi:hypothetical protein